MSDPAGGSGIYLSLEQLLAQIQGQFKEIQADLKSIRAAQDLMGKDFSGFEARVKLHETAAGHAETLVRLAASEHDIDALQKIAEVQQAVQAALEAAAERDEQARQAAAVGRRWLIGLGVTILVFVAGIAVKLFIGQ
jgi:hypothetical protein